MKKAIALLPIFILFLSCGNGDLIIQKAKKNCSCGSNIIEKIRNNEYIIDTGIDWYRNGSFDCDPPFILDELTDKKTRNEKIFAQTNTLELKNNSQTKVYQATIQINNNGKIYYQEYEIEPTEVIELGCDHDFNVDVDYNVNSKIKLTNLSKYEILYKIHKVELISEY